MNDLRTVNPVEAVIVLAFFLMISFAVGVFS